MSYTTMPVQFPFSNPAQLGYPQTINPNMQYSPFGYGNMNAGQGYNPADFNELLATPEAIAAQNAARAAQG